MVPPSTSNSYYDFTADWLIAEHERSQDETPRDRLKALQKISKQLAHQTRNRIRAAKADWQRLRWRVRHKVTDAVRSVVPQYHQDGIHGFVAHHYADYRLTLAHTQGDRLRLQASLAFLNDRVDHRLSLRCYGNRPYGTHRCTDRRTALRRFQRLVWTEDNRWVGKLDVRKFYDTLPHGPVLASLQAAVGDRGCVREIAGYMAWYWEQCWPGHAAPPTNPVGLPQGSPVSAVLANIYMTQFDTALTAAGIEHIRFLDDVTIVARSAEKLADQLEFAMQLVVKLGLKVASKKTQVAYLGPGTPRTKITLPRSRERLQVHHEFDELGMHFYADGTFRARHRTVNRLLSRARREILRDQKTKRLIPRYLRATSTINRMLGYKVSFRRPRAKSLAHGGTIPKPPKGYVGPSRRARVRNGAPSSSGTFIVRRTMPIIGNCWIGGVRYVQPRQHALLGHSALILAQMQRVDRIIRRWMRREFTKPLASSGLPPALMALLRGRRVRSAARMFEMAAREPFPKCPAGAP